MRCHHFASSCLIALTLGISAGRAESPNPDAPPSPLRLLPDRVDLLVQAPQPRRLIETLTTAETLKQIQQLAPVRELLDSTNARRVAHLVAYFEKELGLPWPQLLDRLAGRGVVFGIQFGPNRTGGRPDLALLVIEGNDEKLMQQFFDLGVKLLGQELARQEAKDKPVMGSYKGYNTVRIGADFHAAVAGCALFVSNTEKALHAGLDQQCNGGRKSMAEVPGVHEAAQLLPSQPLITFWLNMTKVRQSPDAKAVYKSPPRDDPALTILFGHYLDLIGRSPFVCASLYRSNERLAASVFLPRGREGMGADKLLRLPPTGEPGSRPLLEPKNVLYSESAYFAIANIWKERTKLFNEKQARQFELAEKKSAPFLIGTKLSKLMTQVGPYYRFVAAHQSQLGYKTTPKVSIPAFALVWELSEPEAFGKSIEPILRGAAFLGGFQSNLKLVQEQYKGCKIVGYRFPEDQPLQGDINDLRFNFTPSFTRVGDQFVVSSTIDLCRELVDLIQKEGTSPTRGDPSTARVRVYGSGVAAYLQTIEDLLITAATLDQAVTPEEARQQVKAFLDIVGGLGVLRLEPRMHKTTFQYDIRLQAEK
jgi:hypothetical protein